MLGLILIYWIGKSFYNLAEEFKRNNWAYAILGVISYYAGSFIGGIILVIGMELLGTMSVDDIDDSALFWVGLFSGGLTCIGIYQFLKLRWRNKKAIEMNDILDSDL